MDRPLTERQRRRHDRWRALLAEYHRSELSQQAFCDAHDLTLSSFSRWRRRLADECASATASSPALGGFVAVRLAEPLSTVSTLPSSEASTTTLSVTLPGGARIEKVGPENVNLAAALIRAL